MGFRPDSLEAAPPADMAALAARMSAFADRYRDAVARGEAEAASMCLLEVRHLLGAARRALRTDRRSDGRTLGLILECIRAGEAVLAGLRGALAG